MSRPNFSKRCKAAIALTMLLFFALNISAQVKKPTLMILPSDNWCTQRYFTTTYQDIGGTVTVPDYQLAFQQDTELGGVISLIGQMLTDRGYSLKDSEQELKATVSVSKLISYAQSKGAETEFAGATFGMNVKMKELNKQNEVKAMDNLFNQLKLLVYDYELEVSKPVVKGSMATIGMTVKVISNNNTDIFYNVLSQTLKSMSMNETEAEANLQYGYHNAGYNLFLLNAPQNLKKYICNLYTVQAPSYSHESNVSVYYFYNEFRNAEFEDVLKTALYSFTIKDNKDNTYPVQVSLPTAKPASVVTNETMLDKKGFTAKKEQVYIKSDNEYEGNCFGIGQGLYILPGTNCKGQLIFQSDKPGIVQYEIEQSFSIPLDRISSISGFEIVNDPGSINLNNHE